MNTKRIVRWVIVLFLLVALPVMTAALAQEPPAPMKEMPAVLEKGESASPAANLTESEKNNSFNTADPMSIGDVMSGKIGNKKDVDYFVVSLAPQYEYRQLLFDIDAQVNGSSLDAVICLYDGSKTELWCNDDSDGLDSLIFYETGMSDKYYIKVREFNYPNEGGNSYSYKLAIYNPLLVSAAKNGRVAGVAFNKADVLAHYDFGSSEKWMLFFDASDLGITQNLVGLGIHNMPGINFVLQKAQKLYVYGSFWDGSVQTVTPYDIVAFWPYHFYDDELHPSGHFGPSTSGSLVWDYRGADYGLTRTSEKIDALAEGWKVSTVGNATFPSGVSVKDEDISNLPYGELLFDGSLVPGLAAEDVIAATVGWDDSLDSYDYYLTIAGSGVVGGYRFTQKDIFRVDGSSYDVVGSGPFWSGPDHHFPYNIDAIEWIGW